MASRFTRIVSVAVATLALAVGACAAGSDAPATVAAASRDTTAAQPKKLAPFRVPSESEIGDSVTLASVRRGRAIIHSTRDSLPVHVGASLSCANCHIADGTQRDAMPLIASYARFPQFRGRSGMVDLIEDRINDCFERSMNGRALAPDSQDMRDIVAYLAFLSRGFPVGGDMEGQGVPALEPLRGDTTRGRAVFAVNCVACHGADGHGTVAAPPLWGPRSFNIGAGMARLNSAARFIHQLMPRDRPGILTPQQAYDVAAYITSRPRPDFAGKENDWPHGGAPPDVAYRTRSAHARPIRSGQ
ncbi:MAG: c-type cytochrome [Gemmatimonadaceae bacterium]|nr:c-type cytochrome [Gemmatimonadaceae bacterium]